MTLEKIISEIIETDYSLGSLRSLHWRSESTTERLGVIETTEGRYILRLYSHPDLFSKAEFISQFLSFLEAREMSVERIIPSHRGHLVYDLPSQEKLIVFRYRPGKPLQTAGPHDYQQWGQYVGRLHSLSEQFQASVTHSALMTSLTPEKWLDRACDYIKPESGAVQIVQRCRSYIASECNISPDKKHTIHGDLWPGNLIVDQGQLWAIDFGEAGQASLDVDLATVYRWLPWHESELAWERWEWWLKGYQQEWMGDVAPISTIIAWAILQHIRYLIEEVEDCINGRDSSNAQPIEYVMDHMARIETLLSTSTGHLA